ncbi:lantibiotic dehydratase [Streptomyces chumphonensis]|uniref:lantibiotic dehydratase n=1 Tax=Streptomyces chumphonensis TaxID=1214925 RepID=UPI003D70A851
MARTLFSAQPVAMARIPLRPYQGGSTVSDGLLAEGVFLASRSAEQVVLAGEKGGRATLRAYDLRSRRRTTPQGVFTGVAAASLTGRTPTLRLDATHRAVTTPSPAWLTAVVGRLLDDEPGLLRALMLTASNLVVRRGGRLEAEHPTSGGTALGSVRETAVSRWLPGRADTCLPIVVTRRQAHERKPEDQDTGAPLEVLKPRPCALSGPV